MKTLGNRENGSVCTNQKLQPEKYLQKVAMSRIQFIPILPSKLITITFFHIVNKNIYHFCSVLQCNCSCASSPHFYFFVLLFLTSLFLVRF